MWVPQQGLPIAWSQGTLVGSGEWLEKASVVSSSSIRNDAVLQRGKHHFSQDAALLRSAVPFARTRDQYAEWVSYVPEGEYI